MVINDLNEATNPQDKQNPAPYLDRFFANVIDFLILVPVISLFNSGVANELRWNIFNQNSTEVYALLTQYGFIGFVIFLLYEMLFIFFNRATPGHRFLFLRLVSESDQPLSLLQIFFRTVFKFQALLAAGIPFVEIAVRRDRSMFYDRLSQTRIVSLRDRKNDEIHPEFKKIILRWAHSAVVIFFFSIGLMFYQSVNKPSASASPLAKSSPSCQETLGQYLKNYLSKAKESENLKCARLVVEKFFEKKSEKTFGYLAQLVVSPNEELRESYKIKYCQSRPNKPLCNSRWNAEYESFKPDEEDVVNLLYEMNAALAKNDHALIFSILDLLYTHLDWNKNLELYYLTSYVFLNEKKDRVPASEKASVPREGVASGRSWSSMKGRFLKRMSVVE